MSGQGDLENIEYGGAGVKGLGKARLYIKLAVLSFMLAAAVYGYCTAYVFASGVSLLTPQAVVILFFVSLAAVLFSLVCAIVCAAKLRTVGKHDLPLILPEGSFDHGNLLARDDKYVWSSRVKAEISAAYLGNRRLTSFNKVSAAMVALQCISLCTAAATFGVLSASSTGYLDAIVDVATSSDILLAQVCLFALTVFIATLVINSIRHGLLDEESRIFVMNEGPRRVSDCDVKVVAQRLNVEPSDIVHVNVHRVVSHDESVHWR
ncbi:hypothetical protein P029_04660 [Anaplasma phagocytophilum str. Norway variant2]|uniref:Uncharacterized protein n=1 Tax=Anaplasma phagocytophilum str. Norway variant2 TaxID=1392507 RepID=A0A161IRH8_ANAPH|nr:hypothetical protein [Anaplasma phagocytophilum]ANC34598.1 hypothetical protein P029_04660 [Anaplasma phagocytophilum str. Norway variant2]